MTPCAEEPRLRWSRDSKLWVTEDPVCWTWNGLFLVVPAGFSTDMASVPRPLTGVIQRTGCWNRAAIFHDWCYYWRGRLPEFDYENLRSMSRAEADRMMLDIMRADGVPWFYRYAMYLAVRAWPLNFWKFSRK